MASDGHFDLSKNETAFYDASGMDRAAMARDAARSGASPSKRNFGAAGCFIPATSESCL